MAIVKKSLWYRILVVAGIVLIIAGAFIANKAYLLLYKPNVSLENKNSKYFYIRTGATFTEVLDSLSLGKWLIDTASFKWLADYKEYTTYVKPGKYSFSDGMSNNDLINMLKSGRQEPVKLVFNNVRTKSQLAGKIAKQLEADSISIMDVLDDSSYLSKFGFTTDNAIVVFIPDTYEIYWNTSASQLFERMNTEYKKFWTAQRTEKAEQAGLTPIEIEILASIVQEETRQYSEMPIIAGLYINRINRGMKLEADPTVKFAVGDFAIKRVLNRHLETDSPYNTYKIKGLPPGPICLPNPKVIEKILAFEKHAYIFMCAKEDFSGYHNFAKTGAEHADNARKYQTALNKRKIK